MDYTVRSITFFNPGRVLGGSEYLLIRVARELHERGFKIYYIDYKDGFARSQLSKSGVIFLDFDPKIKTRIDFDTCIVSPAVFLYRIYSDLVIDGPVKVLFWSLHPLNILNTLPYTKIFKFFDIRSMKKISRIVYAREVGRLIRLLSHLNRNKALYFMDGANFESNRYLFDLDESYKRYIPVCCDDNLVGFAEERRSDGAEVNLGWVGRLSHDKIQPLLNVLYAAEQYGRVSPRKVIMHIIGTGQNEHMLDRFIRSPYIEMRRLGVITGAELDKYLIDHIDVLFAMGASALEGAKLRLPVVLMDVSYRPLPVDYRYRWLFEAEDYTLGEFLSADSKPHLHSFNEIMDKTLDQQGRALVAGLTYEYYKDNHTVAQVAERVLSAVHQSSCRADESETRSLFKPTALKKTMAYIKSMVK